VSEQAADRDAICCDLLYVICCDLLFLQTISLSCVGSCQSCMPSQQRRRLTQAATKAVREICPDAFAKTGSGRQPDCSHP
jgi:hypothetical protein